MINKKNSKLRSLILTVLFLLISSPVFSENIRICFTSDVQGHFSISSATWMNRTFPPPLGGAASLSTFIYEENPDILFDIGNFLGIAPLGDFSKSDLAIFFIERFSYDVLGVGIDDMSGGIDRFKEFTEMTGRTFVSSSILDKSGNYVFLPWTIIKHNEINIGVFSLISSHTSWFIPTWVLTEFTVLKEKEAAEIAVEELRKAGADIIIALDQTSFRHDTLLANEVSGIDVILSGFDGFAQVWESPNNHTIICRIHTDLSSVGLLDIEINNENDIIGYDFQEKTLFTEEYIPDMELEL